jgi:hypothetical protein
MIASTPSAEAHDLARKIDGIAGRGRRDSGDDRDPAACGANDRIDDLEALVARQIGELAGAAERCQAMHAGPDEALDQRRQNVALDPPCLVERRDEIREDAVVAGVKHRQASFDRHRLARTPSHQSHDER